MPVTPDAAGPPVRRAEADDVPEILALSNHYAVHGTANFAHTPEPLEEWMAAWRETSETHPWLMIRDDAATLLGFARAAPWKSRTAYRSATEISVYIHPEHRDRKSIV
jgi:L-amino acid N-acyltransferase